jgi:hypothetical protein
MDLYDLEGYFASYVPIRALSCPLLRYSAAAIAAKQLGRVGRNKTSTHSEQANWAYLAAKYYDKAITFLREALVDIGGQVINFDGDTSARGRLVQEQCHAIRKDDLLTSTSILSVYEFMDASTTEWSGYLCS